MDRDIYIVGGKDHEIHVDKWLRTRNAFAFKFDKKVIQILFNDNTEIRLMKKPTKMISYVNKDRDLFHYSLSIALESHDLELAKRLEYARKITEELIKR